MTDWQTLTTPTAGTAVSISGFFTPLADDLLHLHDLVTRSIINNVGTVVPRGYVGVLSGTAADSLLSTTTPADGRIAAVVMDPTIAAGSVGYVALAGNLNTVQVVGAVGYGDTLQTSGSAGYAIGGSVAPFARAMGTAAGPGAGTVAAVLYAARTPATPQVQELRDTSNVQRFIPNPASKTITDASPTSLADVACASGAMCGGLLFYLVEVIDATPNYQALSGMVSYAAVNKAGTLTLAITEVAGNQAFAASSGTLTLAWSFVTGASKGTIKVTPTGSLTEVTYRITYSVFPIVGTVTIL